MKLEVLFGQDLSAYAYADIEVPDGASEEQVVEAIRAYTQGAEFEELVFEEDWATVSSLRVASVKAGDRYIIEDMAIEPSPYDAGQVLHSWLKGRVPFDAVINQAVASKLIDEPVMEVYTGYLKLPGADRVQVEFACRKGATREEKDLAFFEALAQIGTVDYVSVGEAPKCSTCEHDPAACGDGGLCQITRQEV